MCSPADPEDYMSGSFCTFSKPVPQYGDASARARTADGLANRPDSQYSHTIMDARTEDGVFCIPMLGPGRVMSAPRPCPIDEDDNTSREEDDFAWNLPDQVVLGSNLRDASRSLVLAGDGGWWSGPGCWGIGVVSRTTGQVWSSGGRTRVPQSVDCGDNKLSAAVVEALAVEKMLRIASLRGRRTLKKQVYSLGKSCLDFSRGNLGQHLVIITDRTAVLGNLRRLMPGGRVVEPQCVPSPDKQAYKVVVESILVEIARATQVYERVSVVHKSQFASEAQWAHHEWPPHRLANDGAAVKRVAIRAEARCATGCQLVLSDWALCESLYMHMTFTQDWATPSRVFNPVRALRGGGTPAHSGDAPRTDPGKDQASTHGRGGCDGSCDPHPRCGTDVGPTRPGVGADLSRIKKKAPALVYRPDRDGRRLDASPTPLVVDEDGDAAHEFLVEDPVTGELSGSRSRTSARAPAGVPAAALPRWTGGPYGGGTSAHAGVGGYDETGQGQPRTPAREGALRLRCDGAVKMLVLVDFVAEGPGELSLVSGSIVTRIHDPGEARYGPNRWVYGRDRARKLRGWFPLLNCVRALEEVGGAPVGERVKKVTFVDDARRVGAMRLVEAEMADLLRRLEVVKAKYAAAEREIAAMNEARVSQWVRQ